MIEKELKYLLSKNDYHNIKEYLELYGENKKIIFIYTYYYDCIPYKFLPSITFRIRTWEGIDKYYLSLKANIKGRLPSQEIEELQVAKELNFELGKIDFNKIREKFPLNSYELKELGIKQEAISFIQQLKKDLLISQDYLNFLGETDIERFHGVLQFYNMPFDLDYVKYIGKDKKIYNEDYELEIEDENTDRFDSIVKKIFEQKGIQSLGTKKKIQRLLQYLIQNDN